MNDSNHFILIDDDTTNNMICKVVISETTAEMNIATFNIPEEGFDYIANEYSKIRNELPTILFLDINMPLWTGWDFLENFEKLDDKIKKQIKIYMLTSSVDPKDKERARQNGNVVDYIVKPLSPKIVLDIMMNPNLTNLKNDAI